MIFNTRNKKKRTKTKEQRKFCAGDFHFNFDFKACALKKNKRMSESFSLMIWLWAYYLTSDPQKRTDDETRKMRDACSSLQFVQIIIHAYLNALGQFKLYLNALDSQPNDMAFLCQSGDRTREREREMREREKS